MGAISVAKATELVAELNMSDAVAIRDAAIRLGRMFHSALGDDKGHFFSDEIYSSAFFEPLVSRIEQRGIEEWNKRVELIHSWDGLEVTVLSMPAVRVFRGTFHLVSAPAFEDYECYLLLDREVGRVDFTFQDLEEASISPSGSRFIILGK